MWYVLFTTRRNDARHGVCNVMHLHSITCGAWLIHVSAFERCMCVTAPNLLVCVCGVCVSLSLSLWLCLFLCVPLWVFLSLCVSPCLSISLYLSPCLSVSLRVCLCPSVSLCFSPCLSVYLYVCEGGGNSFYAMNDLVLDRKPPPPPPSPPSLPPLLGGLFRVVHLTKKRIVTRSIYVCMCTCVCLYAEVSCWGGRGGGGNFTLFVPFCWRILSIFVCVCVCVCVCLCVCLCVCTCVIVYACACVYTYICMYTYSYLYVHILS